MQDPASYGPGTYGDAIADVYDEWYADVSDVEGTIEAITALAGGGPVLELGVGTGRLAVPLAARGVVVDGIDASAAMVDRLRAKDPALHVEVADFSERLPVRDGGYAVVFAAFNTLLNLVAPGALERCLTLVGASLRPGGAFVCEAFVPADDVVASGVDVRRVDGAEVVLSVFRREGDVVHGSLVSLRDGQQVRLRPWAIRAIGPDALDRLAGAAGLQRERRDGGWRGERFDDGSDRHVTIYRSRAIPSPSVIGP